MKRKIYNSVIGVLLLGAVDLDAAALEGDAAIQLFNGISLEGWTTAAGKPVTTGWAVEDDMLVRSGRGGSIYSAQEFGDFDLRFEWKISPRGNSGVKYRVAYFEKGVYGHPGWLGCEYQLWDDAGRRTEPHYRSGAIYGLFEPSAEKKLRPIGEFNESRIVVRGSKIEHWLNGAKMVEADTSSDEWKRRIAASKFNDVDGFSQNAKGRIELQDHGSKVWFRNIVVRPLEAK